MPPAARICCARERWWLTWSTTSGVEVPVDTPVFPRPVEAHAARRLLLRRRQRGSHPHPHESARTARIVLPDGLSYRVLILPEDRRLSVEVLRKVRDMVKEGVALVGPKPASESRAYGVSPK